MATLLCAALSFTPLHAASPAVTAKESSLVFEVTGFERSWAMSDTIRLRWQLYSPGPTERTVLAPSKRMREIGAIDLRQP